MPDRTALLLGATGLVGGHVLRLLAHDGRWARVVTFDRRPLPPALGPPLPPRRGRRPAWRRRTDWACDDLFCCLGTTIKKAGSARAFPPGGPGHPVRGRPAGGVGRRRPDADRDGVGGRPRLAAAVHPDQGRGRAGGRRGRVRRPPASPAVAARRRPRRGPVGRAGRARPRAGRGPRAARGRWPRCGRSRPRPWLERWSRWPPSARPASTSTAPTRSASGPGRRDGGVPSPGRPGRVDSEGTRPPRI